MDADGSSMKKLSQGAEGFSPSVSPDGKWVLFSSFTSGSLVLWKADSNGGPAVKVSERVLLGGAVSPDGKYIASNLFDQSWKTGVLSLDSGELIRTFDLPALVNAQWSPDGKALTYVDTRSGVSNIFAQPISGGAPRQLTNFTEGIIFNYHWFPDGKRLAMARGTITSDVVLINAVR
jgi:Tol biopolymer transport system component